MQWNDTMLKWLAELFIQLLENICIHAYIISKCGVVPLGKITHEAVVRDILWTNTQIFCLPTHDVFMWQNAKFLRVAAAHSEALQQRLYK